MNTVTRIFYITFSFIRYSLLPRWLKITDCSTWQKNRVAAHLNWVWGRSPYYQKCVKASAKADLSAYPIIDKSTMMAHLSEINTAELDGDELMKFAVDGEKSKTNEQLFNGRFTVGLSTGTSGKRGLFLASERERAEWVGCILARVLPKPLWRNNRVALFLRVNSSLYEETGQSGIQFKYYDISKDLNSHWDSLFQLQPHVLVAPSSILVELAEIAKARGEVLRPSKIISVAEVLPQETAIFLEQYYGQKIHQMYQATEGFLAHTCSMGRLHLNEDIQLIEKKWIDKEQGLFNPIITDFRRKAQPIIRYCLDDLLQLSKHPCSCGSPFTTIDGIVGRLNDSVKWRSTDKSHDVFVHPDLLCRIMVVHANEISNYRFIQTPEHLIIQVSSGETSQIEHALVDLAESLDAILPKIVFEGYQPLPKEEKIRHVICRG